MKLVVWKNHLGGQILYKSFDPSKNGIYLFWRIKNVYKFKSWASFIIFISRVIALLKNSLYFIFFGNSWWDFYNNCKKIFLYVRLARFFYYQMLLLNWIWLGNRTQIGFLYLTKITIFDQNFDFWPKFRFLTKISILTRSLIFEVRPNFEFWPKFKLKFFPICELFFQFGFGHLWSLLAKYWPIWFQFLYLFFN